LYCEPFAGGAAVFFDKAPVEINVVNDLNGELINFYRVAADKPNELRKEIVKTLHCRKQHERAWYIYNDPEFFTAVQRAWAVFILSKMGYSGQLSGSFGFDRQSGKMTKLIRNAKIAICDELTELLSKATLECDDAFNIIRRYDCPHAFFFIDPPYINSHMGHYGGMFNEQNLRELLELCTTLQGKFMLTMYPNDLIKEFAAQSGWIIHEVDRQVSACAKEYRRRQLEWMVVNYTI
jgi:DNA adenine methylase